MIGGIALLLLIKASITSGCFTRCVNQREVREEICQSRQCIAASHQFFQTMDPSNEACEDFYKFSCGNAGKDQETYNTLEKTQEIVYERIRYLLETENETLEHSTKVDFKTDQIVRDYYRSCMDETRIDELGFSPISIPLKISYINEKWYDVDIEMANLGWISNTNFILSVRIKTNPSNSSETYFYLEEPKFGISRRKMASLYFNTELQNYFDHMKSVGVKLYGKSDDESSDFMHPPFLFEHNIAKISSDHLTYKDYCINVDSYEECQSFPGLPPSLKNYVSAMFPSHNVDESRILCNNTFMMGLSNLLMNTPSNVIKDYQRWRILESSLKYLNSDAREITYTYRNEPLMPRWKTCIKEIGFKSWKSNDDGAMALAVQSLYVRNYFPSDQRSEALSIAENLRSAVVSILDDIKWMDAEGKKAALEKVTKLKMTIGYNDALLNPEELAKIYEGLHIEHSNYFLNRINVERAKFRWRHHGRHTRPSTNEDWLAQQSAQTDWLTLQSLEDGFEFYHPDDNIVTMAAMGLLGTHFYPGGPKYLNFGAMGSSVGHEIGHSLGVNNRHVDHNAFCIEWSEKTNFEYEERIKCFQEQYSEFKNARGLPANEAKHVNKDDEIFSDHVSIIAASRAYDKYVTDNGVEPVLAGHKYTQKQHFWISYAQYFCEKEQNDSWLVENDTHPPNEFRVNDAVSNSEDFARDFKCRPGAPMNPVKKCTLK